MNRGIASLVGAMSFLVASASAHAASAIPIQADSLGHAAAAAELLPPAVRGEAVVQNAQVTILLGHRHYWHRHYWHRHYWHRHYWRRY